MDFLHKHFKNASFHPKYFFPLLLVAFLSISTLVIAAFITLRSDDRIRASEENTITCTPIEEEFFGEKPDTSQAEEITQKAKDTDKLLSQKLNQYVQTSTASKEKLNSSLKETAQQRKELVLETMNTNPDQALTIAKSDLENPENILLDSSCKVMHTTVEGELSITIADFPDKTSDEQYSIISPIGEETILHMTKDISLSLEPESEISVSGYKLDNNLLVDESSLNSGQTEVLARNRNSRNKKSNKSKGKNNNGGGNNKGNGGKNKNNNGKNNKNKNKNRPIPQDHARTLVVLANFQNTPRPAFTLQQAMQLMNDANTYFKENSYGKANVSVAAQQDWIQLPLNRKSGECQLGKVERAVIDALDQRINFKNINRVIIFAPFGPPETCNWSGISSFSLRKYKTNDGVAKMAIIGMNLDHFQDNNAILATLDHELGHSFGLNHADSIKCPPPILYSVTCPLEDGGDSYSVMGFNIYTGHLNIPHLEKLGWLSDNQIITAATPGTYTIEPIETVTGGIKGIRVPRNNGEYIYIEYRQPIGSDLSFKQLMPFNTNIFSGALLHTREGTRGLRTGLIDAAADPSPVISTKDAALELFKVFKDPISGKIIKTTSITGNALTVEISDSSTPTP